MIAADPAGKRVRVSVSGKRLFWCEVAILALAAALRFAALDAKPAHFDEGVNGWFADRMAERGFYEYDPTNYHGPLHMYAVFASQQLFGRNLFALRLPSVLAGLACVWMAMRFGPFIGANAARWAALALAVSPAYVFYARYSIHESWLAFFLMAFAWGVFALWRDGTARALWVIAGATAGMVLTKETYAIHLAAFALAAPCLAAWDRAVPCRPPIGVPAARHWSARDMVLAACAAAGSVVFFYSGTFMNWAGVTGLWTTFAAWFETGVEQGGHAKTGHQIAFFNYYWLDLMWRYEWPALIGLAACFRMLWPAPAFARYLAIYGGGALLAYTIIPYKTPWLIISMLWPFLLLFGCVADEFAKRVAVPAVAASAVAVSLIVSLRLNFFEPTDPRQPYVYVQTFPEIEELTGPLLERARRDTRTHHLPGQILLDSYYPLPWMLGEFTGIAYQALPERASPISAAFVAGFEREADEIERRLDGRYFRRPFRLRDGMDECVVWFRADVFAPDRNDDAPRRFRSER